MPFYRSRAKLTRAKLITTGLAETVSTPSKMPEKRDGMCWKQAPGLNPLTLRQCIWCSRQRVSCPQQRLVRSHAPIPTVHGNRMLRRRQVLEGELLGLGDLSMRLLLGESHQQHLCFGMGRVNVEVGGGGSWGGGGGGVEGLADFLYTLIFYILLCIFEKVLLVEPSFHSLFSVLQWSSQSRLNSKHGFAARFFHSLP